MRIHTVSLGSAAKLSLLFIQTVWMVSCGPMDSSDSGYTPSSRVSPTTIGGANSFRSSADLYQEFIDRLANGNDLEPVVSSNTFSAATRTRMIDADLRMRKGEIGGLSLPNSVECLRLDEWSVNGQVRIKARDPQTCSIAVELPSSFDPNLPIGQAVYDGQARDKNGLIRLVYSVTIQQETDIPSLSSLSQSVNMQTHSVEKLNLGQLATFESAVDGKIQQFYAVEEGRSLKWAYNFPEISSGYTVQQSTQVSCYLLRSNNRFGQEEVKVDLALEKDPAHPNSVYCPFEVENVEFPSDADPDGRVDFKLRTKTGEGFVGRYIEGLSNLSLARGLGSKVVLEVGIPATYSGFGVSSSLVFVMRFYLSLNNMVPPEYSQFKWNLITKQENREYYFTTVPRDHSQLIEHLKEVRAALRAKYGDPLPFDVQLAEIENSKQTSLLDSLLSTSYPGQYFISPTDSNSEGSFEIAYFSKGDSLVFKPLQYTNWIAGEPNNRKEEDCTEFLAGQSGRWNDTSCHSVRSAIVQIDFAGGYIEPPILVIR